MKQPELGRKIVELRKSKGLSQEELVEKCKLNVRTLQRIESGEVMPRGYTLRIIFEELDFEISDLTEISKQSFLENGVSKNPNFTDSRVNLLSIKCIVLIVCVLIGSSCLFYYLLPKPQDKALVKKQIELNNKKYVSFYQNSIDPDFPDFRGQHRIKGLYTNWKSMGKKLISRQSKNMVINDSLVIDIGLIDFEYKINNRAINSPAHYFAQWHLKKGKWRIENEMMYFPGD